MDLKRSAALACLGLWAATATSPAEAKAPPLPRYGVMVFSNLCVDRRGGDYGGERLTLIRRPEGDALVYEYGNGPLSAPVAADNLNVKGDTLTASALNDDQVVFLVAKLGADGAVLTGRGNDRRLQRVTGYDGKIPACH
jgi:hypothetical protein